MNENGPIRRMGRRGYSTVPRSPSETLEPTRAAEPPSVNEPKTKREYHHTLVFMSGTITFALLLFLTIGILFFFARVLYDKAGPLDHSTIVVIPKGEGLNKIAERLERQNIILDRRLFKGAVLYFGAQNKLKAGEYEIPKQASMRQVLDKILEGKSILYKISIPEGLTSLQIVERVKNEPLLGGVIDEMPPEGSMLPDTYKFSRNTTKNELIKRMQAAQQKFLDGIWDQRKEGLPLKTKFEALILASIVEKETGRPDERSHIAGAFINRLNRGIRLQSDPTIIYGLVGGKGKLGRGIRRSEINKRTEYNTYQIYGLPPTPIANPGRDAIIAVLNPKDTQDLYFVADGTGGHAFASTLRDHQNNVIKWRRIERERKLEAKNKPGQDTEVQNDQPKNKSALNNPSEEQNNIISNPARPSAMRQNNDLSITEQQGITITFPNDDSETLETNNNQNNSSSSNPSTDNKNIVPSKKVSDIPLPVKKIR